MDTHLLEIYVDVMRRGSFAAAARDRNVDPSSISRAIQQLESELGLRLFQRTTRHLAATESGTEYYNRILPLVDELTAARVAARDLGEHPVGTLRITAAVSFGQQCLIPLLPSFRKAYPALRLNLLLTDAMIDLVTEQIDLAVRLGPTLPDSTLVAQELMRTHYRVCASPDYLASHAVIGVPCDLVGHGCLTFPFGGFATRWRFRRDGGEVQEVPIDAQVVISNGTALRDCALAGMGPTLLPHWFVDADIAAGRLVSLFPDFEVTATDFQTAAWLVYPSRRYVPRKVRCFIEHLRQELELRPPWLRADA